MPTDKRILRKMAELVNAGVRNVSEMRQHIKHFVEEELFAGQSAPPSTDSRFWPSGKTIMNCIYRTRRQAGSAVTLLCFSTLYHTVH